MDAIFQGHLNLVIHAQNYIFTLSLSLCNYKVSHAAFYLVLYMYYKLVMHEILPYRVCPG